MTIYVMSFLFILQVFSVNGLNKYYIHQIACLLPSLVDVLPNDISANHPGYACVLANVLEAATWILSDAKLASDSVGFLLPSGFLQHFCFKH
jgi:ubiquitin-protein ligase E3 C